MSSTQRGFSLAELMIVVAIISILSAIAIPNYNNYVREAKLIEAGGTLADFRIKLEQFYQDNRAYSADVAGSPDVCGVATPATRYFTYVCVAQAVAGANAQSYTITATSNSQVDGYVYTINAANVRTTTTFAGSAVAGKNCWLVKGSEC